ncbi:MAG: cytochrome c oxidase subunit II, partial [Sphingobacteriaceae bacterium]
LALVVAFGLSLLLQANALLSMRNLSHGTVIELIWTILPAFVLVAIALPSFKALYLADEILSANLTLKVIGHQWYWSYAFDDIAEAISYDSYMLTADSLEPGQLRLLEVDNAVVLPIGTIIRLLGTSTDVIHSFAMPSLGLKVDCMPGRLNQATLLINRTGTFYGQCSELCGAFHSYMPIRMDVVSPKQFVA